MHLKFHSSDLEGSKLWKLSACSVKVSLKYIKVASYLLYAESCLSGTAYIGEVLIQIWLKLMQK